MQGVRASLRSLVLPAVRRLALGAHASPASSRARAALGLIGVFWGAGVATAAMKGDGEGNSEGDSEGGDDDGGVVIGIDLGTTNSCVAVWRGGAVEIIPNEDGGRTTPSVVAFTDEERLVGTAAAGQAARNPTNTVHDAKRLIGRAFADKVIAEDIKHFAFALKAADDGGPLICVDYLGKPREFSPTEISAMILAKMKALAEDYLGAPVQRAVITVPAYFNDAQRQATTDAGTVAGLKVERIINEPTAAALAYGLDAKARGEANKTDADGNNHVLVFDLGGGTFDVTLLNIDDGLFEVKATAGNTHLGGEDFDSKIVDHLAAEFQRKYKRTVRDNPKALRRLRTAAEKAKRALSSAAQTRIEIDSLVDGIDFDTRLTRARFEDLCGELFRDCLAPVERVLKDAGVQKSQVADIVLVGGSTRVPKIQSLLSSYFGGKDLCKSINPDEAVAYGAAVQGAILAGVRDKSLGEILLVDVTPLSLGLETAGGVMTVLIPRNTSIPTKADETFTTHAPNQTSVHVKVFQGERALVADNTALGEFVLEGIAPAPRGVPKIAVTFSVDANGILNVQARDEGSKSTRNLTINESRSALSDEDLQRMLEEAEQFAAADAAARDRVAARNAVEGYAFGLKDSLLSAAAQDPPPVDPAAITDALAVTNETLDWIAANPSAEKSEVEAVSADLQDKVQPVIARINEAATPAS